VLAGLLTDLWDCPPFNEEKKRSGAGKMIPFPGLSFVIGTATKNLGATIPRDLFGSGFMARVIMVYSDESVVPPDMFAVAEQDESLADEIVASLKRIGQLKGEMTWEEPSREDAPVHNLLEDYTTRRWMHVAKLSMIAALADERMTIRGEDVEQAKSWLFDCEKQMPAIFKDMVSHADGQTYADLRLYVWNLHLASKRPITHEQIMAFMSQKANAHTITAMLKVAEAADYIRRVAGTSGDDALYVPGANTGKSELI
jgi:histone H3/H4